MKKSLSREALKKEAAFWADAKKAAKTTPGKACRK